MELCAGATILGSGQRSDFQQAESALIERCRKQDAEAFGRLVDAYQSRVYGFIRRMVGDGEDAADLTQEVFIRAFQSFGRFDGRSALKTWLFRIAYNLCVDRSRRNARTPVHLGLHAGDDDEPIEVPDGRWQPDRIVLDSEMAAVVERAIQSMSEKLRSVLLLHDREDLSYEEIAGTLGVPVGTVKSRLFLARAHLQNHLQSYLQEEKV
jgi:RNA polymerase sigma-70 factor, ECF subfamily